MSNENIKLSELDQNMIIWNAVNTTNPNHVKNIKYKESKSSFC